MNSIEQASFRKPSTLKAGCTFPPGWNLTYYNAYYLQNIAVAISCPFIVLHVSRLRMLLYDKFALTSSFSRRGS